MFNSQSINQQTFGLFGSLFVNSGTEVSFLSNRTICARAGHIGVYKKCSLIKMNHRQQEIENISTKPLARGINQFVQAILRVPLKCILCSYSGLKITVASSPEHGSRTLFPADPSRARNYLHWFCSDFHCFVSRW